MKNQINFNLSKRNRRAVILLSFILLFIIYIPRIYYFFKNEDKISLNSFPSKKWEYENRKSTNYHKKITFFCQNMSFYNSEEFVLIGPSPSDTKWFSQVFFVISLSNNAWLTMLSVQTHSQISSFNP